MKKKEDRLGQRGCGTAAEPKIPRRKSIYIRRRCYTEVMQPSKQERKKERSIKKGATERASKQEGKKRGRQEEKKTDNLNLKTSSWGL